MMKRLLNLGVVLSLAISLVGCSAGVKKPDKVVVLPKPKTAATALTVAGIDDLHHGTVWDNSADGKTLLFSWNQDKQRTNPNIEVGPPENLYTMDLANQQIQRISTGMNENNAQYSPDGTKITFLTSSEETFAPFIMDNQVNAPYQAIPGSQLVSRPIAWSPDSQLFAIAYWYLNKGKIVLYDRDGKEKRTIHGADMKEPYFYDQNTIMYLTGDAEKTQIMYQTINNGDSNPVELTKGTHFSVAPSKKYLAYLSAPDTDGKTKLNISVMDNKLKISDPMTQIQLSSYTHLAWSLDSRFLAYSDNGSLWLVNLQTHEKKQLVSDMKSITNILWPAAKTIIFSGQPNDDTNGFNHIYRITLK